MYCKKCGKEIPDDSVFCEHCGTPVEEHEHVHEPSNIEESSDKDMEGSVEEESNIRSVEELTGKSYEVRIGRYISRGWEIFSSYMGGFIGYFVIVYLISFFLSLIPLLGQFALIAISGPLNAGFVIVAFKKMKGQEIEFGDFFLGFNYFLPLLLMTLVVSVFVLLGFLALILPGIYLAISYTFAVPLIVDRKYDFWQAMEASRKVITKKWFSVFGFVIVLGLLNIAGALALLVGLLFTAPWTSVSIAAAYEDIYGLEASDFSKP